MIKNDQICWTTAVVQYQSGDKIMGDMLVIYLFLGGKIVHSLSIFMGLLDHSTIFTGWWRSGFPAKRDYENPSKPTNNTGFECSSFWDHPRMNALPELGGQQLQLGSLLKLRKNNHTITNQAWEKDSSVLNFQCLIGDIACLGGTWGTDNKHVLFRYFKYHICCSSAANQCTLFSIIHGGLPTLESPNIWQTWGRGNGTHMALCKNIKFENGTQNDHQHSLFWHGWIHRNCPSFRLIRWQMIPILYIVTSRKEMM